MRLWINLHSPLIFPFSIASSILFRLFRLPPLLPLACIPLVSSVQTFNSCYFNHISSPRHRLNFVHQISHHNRLRDATNPSILTLHNPSYHFGRSFTQPHLTIQCWRSVPLPRFCFPIFSSVIHHLKLVLFLSQASSPPVLSVPHTIQTFASISTHESCSLSRPPNLVKLSSFNLIKLPHIPFYPVLFPLRVRDRAKQPLAGIRYGLRRTFVPWRFANLVTNFIMTHVAICLLQTPRLAFTLRLKFFLNIGFH